MEGREHQSKERHCFLLSFVGLPIPKAINVSRHSRLSASVSDFATRQSISPMSFNVAFWGSKFVAINCVVSFSNSLCLA
jgi:hypothetical protein